MKKNKKDKKITLEMFIAQLIGGRPCNYKVIGTICPLQSKEEIKKDSKK